MARRTYITEASRRPSDRVRRRRRAAAVLALVAIVAVVATLIGVSGGTGSHAAKTTAAKRLGKPFRPRVARAPAVASLTTPKVVGAAEPPGRPVPVLMYHVTQAPPPGSPYPQLFVTPANLRAQVRALARAGYHAVTLSAVWSYWHKGTRLPRKPVVLTFDDGYRSNYTEALPILRAAGWPGVLFLEVADLKKKDFEGISPDQVRALTGAGWELGAHTMTHADLTTVDPAQLRYEVKGSRDYIRKHFGQPVRFFAYPASKYNPTVEAAVRQAGFDGAVTELEGPATKEGSATEIKRVRVNGSDSAQSLLSKVQSGG